MKNRAGRLLPGLLTMLLLCSLLLAGCTGDEKEQEQGGYSIYYTNTEGTKLAAVSYEPKAKEEEALADELLTQLGTPPDETDTKVAMPASVTVEDVQYDQEATALKVFFSASYAEMDTVTEVLCRAAYVRTLTQMPGVSYVEFYVDGTPLTNAEGEEVGLMTQSEFIDNTEAEFSAYEVGEVTLYYANQEGARLVECTQEAVLGTSVSTERIILDALIAGPLSGTDGVCATIPEGTKLLNVSTDNGICYVNLSEEFLVPRPDVTEMVSLYSIVNSLCELSTVDQVQFAINGDTERTYYDNITFSVPFTANEELVEMKAAE